MTKTEVIVIYDRTLKAEPSLASIAKYLAQISDKKRRAYLDQNPNVADALRKYS